MMQCTIHWGMCAGWGADRMHNAHLQNPQHQLPVDFSPSSWWKAQGEKLEVQDSDLKKRKKSLASINWKIWGLKIKETVFFPFHQTHVKIILHCQQEEESEAVVVQLSHVRAEINQCKKKGTLDSEGRICILNKSLVRERGSVTLSLLIWFLCDTRGSTQSEAASELRCGLTASHHRLCSPTATLLKNDYWSGGRRAWIVKL